eukprot:scaffold7257_cov177-Amphora_coffeaeformis.AAC.1
MFRQFITLPKGSIAVIAADTMLRIPQSLSQNSLQQSMDNAESVVVLTVPASFHTAKNHGVFILEDDTNWKSGQLSACRQVLQKPSIATLRELAATNNNHDNDQAWIDTGVLLFFPRAARTLQILATQEASLYGCTRVGLELLHQQQEQASSTTQDIMAFSSKHSLSVDLYTHILQVLKISGLSMTWEMYREKFSDLPEDTARSLYDKLSRLSMKVWAEPEGRFLHLGTTLELMDFYMSTTLDNSANHPTLSKFFANDLGLCSRQQVIVSTTNQNAPMCADDSVLYHSILQAHNDLSIGRKSIAEFCRIECSNLKIGDNCWVSGLRGTHNSAVVIPDGLVVQELTLTEQTHVYMVLGVDDPVKSASMLYGRPWDKVASRVGLTASDIWDCDMHTLWNAKVHPIIRSDERLCFSDLFAWLSRLDDDELPSDPSIQEWLNRPRLSLADIRQQADASLEFSYREQLSAYDIPAARTLLYAQTLNKLPSPITHSSSTINEAHELLRDSWRTLFDHMLGWVSNGMYDILGASATRYAIALQAIGALADDLSLQNGTETEGQLDIDSLQNVSGEPLKDGIMTALHNINSQLVSTPEKPPSSHECKALASILLAISAACTRICVGSDALDGFISIKPTACLGRWVVATAPARIDIAGGWSDTPPICFEHGSVGTLISFAACRLPLYIAFLTGFFALFHLCSISVTGMAVLVDGCAPLACRVRVATGGTGVLLRSESRTTDGELISSNDVEVQKCDDLKGFNSPTSNCALLKCALVCLGLLSPDQIYDPTNTDNFGECVRNFFGADCPVRVEIISTSILPHGSGMGTSSILAGCILAAIAQSRGTPLTLSSLIQLALQLEQRLTTGGGFQDQANGLVGGVKRVSCVSGVVQPVRVDWTILSLAAETEARLNGCLHLVYTGQTRLAKNILQQCLHRWSERTHEICQTVSNLVDTANASVQALENGDLNGVGSAVKEYWKQKKIMAGVSSGVEPPLVARVLDSLYKRDLIRCGTLCGAGGGGFLMLLSKDGVKVDTMMNSLKQDGVETSEFTWHSVRLDPHGLVIQEVDVNDFHMSFLQRQ